MHDLMLAIHFMGLAMLLGGGLANVFLRVSANRFDPLERRNFMPKVSIPAAMGQIGFGLILLSGLYLLAPYRESISTMPLLRAKLSLVFFLLLMGSIMAIVVKRAKKQGNEKLLKRVEPFGILSVLIAIIIVILAVLTFH